MADGGAPRRRSLVDEVHEMQERLAGRPIPRLSDAYVEQSHRWREGDPCRCDDLRASYCPRHLLGLRGRGADEL
ncbi:MAG: hypothetical protein AAF447_16585 [Myxococcota bacterium]